MQRVGFISPPAWGKKNSRKRGRDREVDICHYDLLLGLQRRREASRVVLALAELQQSAAPSVREPVGKGTASHHETGTFKARLSP